MKNKLNFLNIRIDRNKKDLERLQSQLNDLTKKLLKSHPKLEEAEENYAKLQSQLEEAEKNLTTLPPELDDEILDLKFIIKKLKKEKIPPVYDELSILKKKEEGLRTKIHTLQEKRIVLEEEIAKNEKIVKKIQQDEDRLFKKLYVEFDDDVLSKVFKHFNLHEPSDEDNLKLLVHNYSEETIYYFINPEKNRQKVINELMGSEEKYREFISNHMEELCKIYPVSKYSSKTVERLMNKYSPKEILDALDNPNTIKKQDKKQEKELSHKKKVCPNCGKELHYSAVRCFNCNYVFGTKIKKVEKKRKTGNWCDNCFTDIPENSEHCPFCGSINILLKKHIGNPTKKPIKRKIKPMQKPIKKSIKKKPTNYNHKISCPICGKLVEYSSSRCPYCNHKFSHNKRKFI